MLISPIFEEGRTGVVRPEVSLDSMAPQVEVRAQGGALSAGACRGGYRSSRLTTTVSRTEAMIENRIMNRQPGPPPNGRIWIRPRLIRACSFNSRSSDWLFGAGCVAWPGHAVRAAMRPGETGGPGAVLLIPGPPGVVARYDLVLVRERAWEPAS